MTAVIPCKLTIQNILHEHLFMFSVHVVDLETPYS